MAENNISELKTRILIVEDERLAAEDLSIRLQQKDYVIVGIAGTGTQAIKLTAETNPDIILMDIKLRGRLNGIEVAKRIHETHPIPVVFATAYGDDEHISQAMQEADAYGFLHKPIDEQAAATMIKIALRRFATDQMMLRINELLSMKDFIQAGLEKTESIEDIGVLLNDSFTATSIFKEFWLVLWNEAGEIAATQSQGIEKKVFSQYLKNRDRKSLENQRMMLSDELMTKLLGKESALILIRGENNIVGLVGFTWRMGMPNFRNEFAVVKDVARQISQSIRNTQLKDEQVKAQKQVADTEAHIKAIVEQSTTGIYIVDHNSSFVYVNDRTCEIYGRSREELIGSNFSEHLGPSRLKVVMNYEARQAGKEAPREYSLDIMRPDGEMRDILISANSFVDSEGNVKNIGHALDVTEQNLANLELKKLSQAVEQSPVMTVITDVEGTIQYVNAKFVSVMGYSHEELIGQNPRVFKSDEHDKKFYKQLWDSIKNGTTWNGDIINRKKDGQLTWGKVSISPIRNTYGIITHFVALHEDITRQKHEEQRALRDQKLRDVLFAITSEAIKANDVSSLYEKIYLFISEIISSSNFYLAIHDKKENTISFPYEIDLYNSEMPESIPCDPERSLTARTILEGRTLHVEETEIRELIESGQVMIAGELPSVWLGIPLRVKDEVIGAFVLQEYGGLSRYDDEDVRLLDLAAGQVALTIDRARKSKALEELANQLASANDMKELLLDVITHDLRNPAGVISAMTDMMISEDQGNEMYEVLQGSAESLMNVIENATVLSKLSIGENIAKEELDLVEMIHGMRSEFASQLDTSSMTLEFDLPKKFMLEANPIIGEIPKNYISNAIKYGSPGSNIKIILDNQGEQAILRVNNHGTPVPEELRESIFERNVQLGVGKKKGRGLGLAIVKRIARAHDAMVGIENTPDGGNSFYLKF